MDDMMSSGACRGLTMEQWEAMRKENWEADGKKAGYIKAEEHDIVACRNCGVLFSRKHVAVYLDKGKTLMECVVCHHETDIP